MTEASIQAIGNLRTLSGFEWYIVPLLALVIYVYSVEARKKEWGRIVIGIGFFAGELVWEMINALVLHFSDYSALWTVSGKSVFLIFVGLNLEIAFMFAMAPIVLLNCLPEDPAKKIGGIPNRIIIPGAFGLFCVFVEVMLNRWGALVWAYRWWSWPNIWFIIVAYVLPFLFLAWFNDRFGMKGKLIGAGITIAGALTGYCVFAAALGWI
jgi:hypothetical protein